MPATLVKPQLPARGRRYEKYVPKEGKPATGAGPDAFEDEYHFIMGQADELTMVRRWGRTLPLPPGVAVMRTARSTKL